MENKTKLAWLQDVYCENPGLLNDAIGMYQDQRAIHEVLTILRDHADELGNKHVIRLIEGYFLEMAVVVAELGRVTRSGGTVIMVNDNVQYHGEEVPVDLILSDFAEHSGFVCEDIWMLPRGKGNSSQQMRRFGRREIQEVRLQVGAHVSSLRDARIRSTLMSERIRLRTDHELRELINGFTEDLDFRPLDDLMISEQAWEYAVSSDIGPKLVFAHPTLLQEHPRISQYYRGIALLPQKRVADIAVPVSSWEDGSRRLPIKEEQSLNVARLYNGVISSIIEGTTNWTLENGYRNIIANMGIGLDGTFRNIIGRDAEDLVKTRIKNWL